MAKGKCLAWECDESQLRFVIARLDGAGGLQVERAGSESLSNESGGLVDALKRVDFRGDSIFVASRCSGEMRRLTLPPAPDDELPELLKFQATREFAGIEEPAIDFVPLHRTEEGVEVIAAATPGSAMKLMGSAADSAGAPLKQVVLRPFAIDAYWRNRSSEPALLMAFSQRTVDLVLTDGANVQVSRTVRIPEDSSHLSGWLAREVRRTRGAGGSARPEKLVVFGADRRALADEVAGTVGMQAECVEGIEDVANPDQFVALIGALQEHSRDARPALDLLSPRKPPPPVDHGARLRLYALSVVLLLLVGLGGLFLYDQHLKSQATALAKQRADTSDKLRDIQTELNEVEAVDGWLENDMNWLVELERISQNAPDSESIRLEMFNASITAQPGGRISLQGKAAHTDIVTELEDSLRDDRRQVQGRGSTTWLPDEQRWKFTSTLTIAPEERPDLESSPGEFTPADTESVDADADVDEAVETEPSPSGAAPNDTSEQETSIETSQTSSNNETGS